MTFRGSKEHTFEECLFECDHKCLPFPILMAITQNTMEDEHTPEMVSVTSLNGCLREKYLSSQNDYYIEPYKMWYTTRGTLMHSILELPNPGKIENPNFKKMIEKRLNPERYIVEKRFYIDFDGYKLSGKIDFFDKELSRLSDFKTIGDKGIHFLFSNDAVGDAMAKREHRRQCNVYRLLMEKNGIPVKEIEIIYVTMMTVLTTGTKYYKQEGKNKVWAEYNVDQVELEDIDWLYNWAKTRTITLSKAMQENIMPEPLEDIEQKGWRCGDKSKGEGYCPVRFFCSYWQEKWGETKRRS